MAGKLYSHLFEGIEIPGNVFVRALGELPAEKQLDLITEVLVKCKDLSTAQAMFWALRDGFFEKNPEELRTYLRKIYKESFGPKGKYWHMNWFGNNISGIAILKEILKGWNDASSKDAEECFLFFCATYTQAQDSNESFAKAIGGLFSEAVKDSWNPDKLDSWIARKELPEELVLVLAKARMRTLTPEQAQKEARIRSGLKQKGTETSISRNKS